MQGEFGLVDKVHAELKWDVWAFRGRVIVCYAKASMEHLRDRCR